MEIKSVSGHALDRFREHAPQADVQAVLLAARMAIPIPSDLAHMLAGRPYRAAAARDHSAHRLHLTGAGIFVLCPIVSTPGVGYVKTYLRLVSVVQREMVQRWFLEGISPVSAAFELGFRAAREAPESVTPGEALEAYAAEILRLAAHAGARAEGPAESAPTQPAAPAVSAPAAPPAPVPDATPHFLTPTRAPQAKASLKVKPSVEAEGVAWTPGALDQRAWFLSHDARWVADMARWRRLTLLEQTTLRSGNHVGPMGPATTIWLEPAGRAAAFIVESPDQPPVVHRLSAVPRAARESLGLPGKLVVKRPGAGAPPAQDTPPPVALPAVTETPLPVATDDTPAAFVPAQGLRVTGWLVRARADARTAGLAEIAPPYLTHIPAVPVEDCAALAEAFGWAPQPGRRYAMRRGAGYVLLLVATGRDAGFGVARCARDTPPRE